MQKVYVTAAAMTKVGRHFNLGFKELAYEVVERVIEESGGEAPDYLIVSSTLAALQCHQLDVSTIVAQALGLSGRRRIPSIRVETGESSGAAAVEIAVAMVRSGMAKKVLVVGFEKMTEYPSAKVNADYSKILDYELEVMRNVTPPNYAAMIMKDYMRRYGVSREDLTSWPVRMHENASRNPLAQLPFKISKDAVLKAQVISEPITLLDSFPLGDGAAALMIAGGDFIPPGSEGVEVLTTCSSTSTPLYLRDELASLPATASLRKVADAVLPSGWRKDAAVQVHDSYSIYGVLALEALGFAEPGQGYRVVEELEYLNPGGGLKARGHPIGATPIYGMCELYALMMEGFAGLSFSGSYGLVHSMSGPDYNSRLIILKR